MSHQNRIFSSAFVLLWAAAPGAFAGAVGERTPPPRQEEISTLHRDLQRALLSIQRIHVEPLSGGNDAQHVRDMIISELRATGLFILTEDPDRADAIIRGSAEDMIYTDHFSSSERDSGRGSIRVPLGKATSRVSRSLGLSSGIDESESIRKTERKHEALASVRLFNKDGDVLWATVQQSTGGKFDSAPADLARKIARQLQAAFERANRELASGAAAPSTAQEK